MKILITGSAGLVGSTAGRYYLDKGCDVVGIDNDMRSAFFGREASVCGNIINHAHYKHIFMDIRKCEDIVRMAKPDVIIHAAAQPSHDWSAIDPKMDFFINATGTVYMLETYRRHCPKAVFIYVSTNKVYGDMPNMLPLKETLTRYDVIGGMYANGISEAMPIDECMHSPFGVSKLAGDLMAQEYAKYFGLQTGIFRCGCITGKAHVGAELHGFLAYMAKCKKEHKTYRIYGYKGKQVRDNIHAYDLVTAFDEFVKDPRPGEVYNIGGGRHSNISVLEALNLMQVKYEYIDQPRKGDHKWYISDVSKFKNHYPDWKYAWTLEKIIEDIISA